MSSFRYLLPVTEVAFFMRENRPQQLFEVAVAFFYRLSGEIHSLEEMHREKTSPHRKITRCKKELFV